MSLKWDDTNIIIIFVNKYMKKTLVGWFVYLYIVDINSIGKYARTGKFG